jgi:phospholipid-binding lipoprotein MlaA
MRKVRSKGFVGLTGILVINLCAIWLVTASWAQSPGGPKLYDDEATEVSSETIPDPLMPMNKFFFQVNDKLYFYGLKPVAKGYKAVLPERVRVCVKNFLYNIAMPIRLINSILQGKPGKAGIVLGRFIMNTTIGVAGLFDPAASKFGLEKVNEDTGQTLGVYGMKKGGFYLDVPVLGPSCFRDIIGFVGDTVTHPLFYVNPWWVFFAEEALKKVNTTSLTLGEYEEFKASSLDPYTALKDAYFQHRRALIAQ